MTTPVIRTRGLVKDYGRTRALAGLDLEVQAGEVYGFIGPNGAGKSTTIRILLDLLRPTAGEAEVLGQAPAAGGPALRARIGYLPGELAMPARVTAREQLAHLAALRGGRGSEHVDALAERFTLDLDRPLRALSRGNKQKLGVIQAFMHEPELLILDEPTSGLDPLLQHEFLDLVRETSARGATVFMSSHVLREVESVADRVAVIREGRTVDVDSVRGLRARAGQRVSLTFAEAPDLAAFEALDAVRDVRLEGATLHCLLLGEPDALLKLAARSRVTHWAARDLDLEDLFMDVYRYGPDGVDGANGVRDAR
ncbi:MAG: ABC transporter ATP-binding protein [Trueperaceae bacterium]